MWSTLPPPFTLEQATIAVDPLAGQLIATNLLRL